MDWQKNRLWIGAVALLVLGGAAIWAVSSRTGDTPRTDRDAPSDFPEIDRDDVTALEITRPGEDGGTIRLERDGDAWRLTQPIEAPADHAAVTTALDKLDELEVAGIAASAAQFHERLEVDAAHGVRVIARGSDGDALADLWIGAYRGGNTMVRVEGDDRVVSVRGSIKFAFNKELRDWRDRAIVDLEADDVREIAWVGPNGTFRFTRPEVAAEPPSGETAEGEAPAPGTTLGDWQMTEVSYVPPAPEPAAEPATPPRGRPAPPAEPTALTTIEGFAPSKVRSMVGSLARMRASDFAAADVTAESAGFTAESPRVTLTAQSGEERTSTTVILGNEANAERHDFYAMREGDPTIYVVSRFLSERIHPTAVAFTQTAPPSTPEPTEGGGEPGGIQMPEGAGGQLPPEVMEQIRRQLEAQGMGGGAGP